MNKLTHYEVLECTYDTKEERTSHVTEMTNEGWFETGEMKRLKRNVSVWKANDNDYEWYAHFTRKLN